MSIETPKTMNLAIIEALEKRVRRQGETIVELLDERDNWRMVARLSQVCMMCAIAALIGFGILLVVYK